MSASYAWWVEPASLAGVWFLRLLGGTWRLELVGTESLEAGFDRGQRWIFAFWHARLLPLCFSHRDRGMAVLISRHQDGQLIARIIERLGYATARGSSTRGGEHGLRGLVRWVRLGRVVGIAPDGPRGPAEVVKPGIIYLASKTGLPVVPVASAARSFWQLRSWDGFRIPRPFTKVLVGYGEPIAVPPALEEADLGVWQQRVQQAVTNLTLQLDRLVGSET